MDEEAIKIAIEMMEKEIVYFTGKKRIRAKKRYLRLIRSCGKTCGMEDPIFLDRI